jgi:hypothetical protein
MSNGWKPSVRFEAPDGTHPRGPCLKLRVVRMITRIILFIFSCCPLRASTSIRPFAIVKRSRHTPSPRLARPASLPVGWEKKARSQITGRITFTVIRGDAEGPK